RCLCCTKGGLWMAEELPLYMGHNLERIPRFPLPAGYRYRYFDTQMDAKSWANVVTKTKEFPHVDKAMERFKEEFYKSFHCFIHMREFLCFCYNIRPRFCIHLGIKITITISSRERKAGNTCQIVPHI